MIKPELNLFKIHRKVIFGNPSIIVQHMFRITPKPFNAVNVILGSFVDHMFVMLHRVMLAQTFQAVVTPELVGKIDRTFSCFLLDNLHQFRSRDSLHNPRVHSSIALQKAKYNAFTLCTPSSSFLCVCRQSSPHPSQSRPTVCVPQVQPCGRGPHADSGILSSLSGNPDQDHEKVCRPVESGRSL